jgi:phosphoribosylformimino-5-aminoimidazole carboxamide ribotide isomerase
VLKWKDRFGAERIIIAADFKEDCIAVSGWKEETRLALDDFIDEKSQKGFRHFLCTDIARDGMLSGPAFETYARIKAKLPEIELIASGGISRIEDVKKLNDMNMDAVIIGKALYENKIMLEELEPYIC